MAPNLKSMIRNTDAAHRIQELKRRFVMPLIEMDDTNYQLEEYIVEVGDMVKGVPRPDPSDLSYRLAYTEMMLDLENRVNTQIATRNLKQSQENSKLSEEYSSALEVSNLKLPLDVIFSELCCEHSIYCPALSVSKFNG